MMIYQKVSQVAEFFIKKALKKNLGCLIDKEKTNILNLITVHFY